MRPILAVMSLGKGTPQPPDSPLVHSFSHQTNYLEREHTMLRSLFTGVSGLRTHQTMLDVTGNNIANVNTNGFKSSQTQFTDTLSQMIQGAAAPETPPNNENRGGTNPAQVGLGVKLAGITTNFGQGSTQLTGRPTDMMIRGDGFFVVREGNEVFYTRAGSYSWDAENTLVAPNGSKILGVKLDAAGASVLPDGTTAATFPLTAPKDELVQIKLEPLNGTAKLTGFEIGPDGTVTASYDDDTEVAVAKVAIADFANAAGLVKNGNSLYRPSQNSGEQKIDVAGVGTRGMLSTGTLEMSNVDLAQEFTNMIIAQRGLQANSRTITTSDEVLQELISLKR